MHQVERARDRRGGHREQVRVAAPPSRERSRAGARRTGAAHRRRRAPGAADSTPSWMTAWVPTKMSISPALAPRESRADLSPGSQPVSNRTRGRPPIRQSGVEHAECLEMLLGQDLGRRHQAPGCLGGRDEHGRRRHGGLAGADVTLQQPGHRLLLAHVFENLGQDRLLRAREPERQRRGPVLQQRFVGFDRDAVVGLALALA